MRIKLILVAALTFSASNLAYAQNAPRYFEIAVLKPADSPTKAGAPSVVIKVPLSPKTGADSTAEIEDCFKDLLEIAKQTKARGGIVFSTPNYTSIGDQSQVENVRNVLVGLRCELSQ